MSTSQESDRAAVVAEYNRLAKTYDSRWSFYVDATSRETLARLSVDPSDRILDVGSGTGALLSMIAAVSPATRLCGIDASSEMLDIARQILPGADLRQGWAEELPYADQHFDAVVSCNMFHLIRDPAGALREMLRVLKPGGTLVITDWCDDYITCRLCDWYLRCFDRSYLRIYGVRTCREMLQSAGSRNVRIERYKISWLWGLMTAVSSKPDRFGSEMLLSPDSVCPDAA